MYSSLTKYKKGFDNLSHKNNLLYIPSVVTVVEVLAVVSEQLMVISAVNVKLNLEMR